MWYQSSKNNAVDTFQSRWITQRLIGYMLAGSDWACSHNCLSQLELRTEKSCHFFNNHSLYTMSSWVLHWRESLLCFLPWKNQCTRHAQITKKMTLLCLMLLYRRDAQLFHWLWTEIPPALQNLCWGKAEKDRLMFDLLQKEKNIPFPNLAAPFPISCLW